MQKKGTFPCIRCDEEALASPSPANEIPGTRHIDASRMRGHTAARSGSAVFAGDSKQIASFLLRRNPDRSGCEARIIPFSPEMARSII